MSVTVAEDVKVKLASKINVHDSSSLTEDITATLPPIVYTVNIYDSISVTEDISSIIGTLLGINIYDSSSLTESIGRNLKCLIKPVTGGTFGKTTAGSLEGSSADRQLVCKFQSGSAGTLQSITLFTKYWNSEAHVKCAIYDASFNLLANGTTEEKTVIASTDGEMTFNFATPPSVSASTNYYLAWWSDEIIYRREAAGSSNQMAYDAKTYNSWNATLVPDGYYNIEVSIYATYCTAGPVEAVSVAESILTTGLSRINVNDPVGVTDTDAVSLLTLFNLIVNDTVGVAEDINSRAISHLSVYDTITLAENISNLVPTCFANVHDSVALTEYIKATLIVFISKSETITLAEAVTILRTMPGISVYDAVALTEGIIGNMWQERIEETDTWTERTKETDAWTERTKETDTWTERPHKEGA